MTDSFKRESCSQRLQAATPQVVQFLLNLQCPTVQARRKVSWKHGILCAVMGGGDDGGGDDTSGESVGGDDGYQILILLSIPTTVLVPSEIIMIVPSYRQRFWFIRVTAVENVTKHAAKQFFPLKTNIFPENWWLEDEISHWNGPLSRDMFFFFLGGVKATDNSIAYLFVLFDIFFVEWLPK